VANPRRNQGHLGIDTNVLVAYLDGDHPSHGDVTWLANRAVALGPTIVHEAYHTMVFKMKWREPDARSVLLDACSDPHNAFLNQTLRTTRAGLSLAVAHKIGGRDALILASLLAGGVRELVTFDKRLLELKKIEYGKSTLTIKSP